MDSEGGSAFRGIGSSREIKRRSDRMYQVHTEVDFYV